MFQDLVNLAVIKASNFTVGVYAIVFTISHYFQATAGIKLTLKYLVLSLNMNSSICEAE